jgi:hypothetical protein
MSKANVANRWRSMVERLSYLPRVRRVWFVLAALAFEQLKTNTLLMYFRYGAWDAKIRGLRSPVPVRLVVPFSPCFLFPTHEDQLSPYDYIAEYCKR